jgi:transcriptional regulator with XRE-family HTH domain
MERNGFKSFRSWLLYYINRLGMTVEGFSIAAGLSKYTVYRYLQQVNDPTVKSLGMLCTYIGKRLDKSSKVLIAEAVQACGYLHV